MEKVIRVLVVDDHQIIQEGLRSLFGLEENIEIVGQYTNPDEALPKIGTLSPDIVLMDIKMPGMDGIELTRRISQTAPSSKVIMLSMYDNYLNQAMEAGARGYLLKGVKRDQLSQAIKTVCNGQIVIDGNIVRRSKLGDEEERNKKIDEAINRGVTELNLIFPPPVDIKQVTRFAGQAEDVLQSRMRQLLGSSEEGIKLRFIFFEPVELDEITNKLENLPEVDAITDELKTKEPCPVLKMDVDTAIELTEKRHASLFVTFENEELEMSKKPYVARESFGSFLRGVISPVLERKQEVKLHS